MRFPPPPVPPIRRPETPGAGGPVMSGTAPGRQRTIPDGLGDARLVALALDGDGLAARILIRRHNRRLFRVARAIVRDDSEAEDVVQASYARAFTRLGTFRAESGFATWLTRIAINEALGHLRRRRRRPSVGLDVLDTAVQSGAQVIPFPNGAAPADPESEMSRTEVRALLEQAVDALPDRFRSVFVLREVEQMSVAETARQLGLRQETVKTRLHRARRLLREAIDEKLSGAFPALFPFDGERCAQMAERVIALLAERPGPTAGGRPMGAWSRIALR